MRKKFVAVALSLCAAMFIACGGGSKQPYTGDLDFPAPGTVRTVEGVYMSDAGAMAADKLKLADFVHHLGQAPDISRNMLIRGEVKKISNGSRVEIRFIREEYEIANVQIMDGPHAGEIGFMDARECGATKKVAASAQHKAKK